MGRKRFCFALLLLLVLAGTSSVRAAESDERVEVFLDETAALYGPSEADVVRKLGPPRERQTVPFTSPHDAAAYEIITLTYDGLLVSLYSMEEGQRQFFHQIRITAGPACFARNVCRGVPRERLGLVLGPPEEVEDHIWRYSDLSGYNELAFTFDAAGAVDTLTWTAEAD
ncbi:hypothetical protein [Solidesulfovibrio sp.]